MCDEESTWSVKFFDSTKLSYLLCKQQDGVYNKRTERSGQCHRIGQFFLYV